jgi:putative transposase
LKEDLVALVRKYLDLYPAYGIKKLTWKINGKEDLPTPINWKSVYRVLKRKGWVRRKRRGGLRPRVRASRSACDRSNKRWAIDTTHLPTQRGFCHLTAVIDCCDRSIVGWRISYSGKATVAAAALEDAFLKRRPDRGLLLRSDNGLVFGS